MVSLFIPTVILLGAFAVGALVLRNYLRMKRTAKAESAPAAPAVQKTPQAEANEERAKRLEGELPKPEQPEGIGPILKRAISKEIERPIREGRFKIVIKNRGAVVNSGAEPQWEIEFPEDKPVELPATDKEKESQVRAPTQSDVSGEE
ncbi:MAG: hypothetical protein KGI38_11790 [Thaumarchaeota archaeon]|nr:hypothetical protein [Nitrososphaerota archaeon]